MNPIRNNIKENLWNRAFLSVRAGVSVHIRREEVAFNVSTPAGMESGDILYTVYDSIRGGE